MIPLCFANLNTDYYIKELNTCNTRQKEFIERGFHIGAKINIHERRGNSFLVKVNDLNKYVIGFGMARNIMIDENK